MDTPAFRWGHVNINVADLERSIEFYRKLGFVEFLPGIPYLALEREGQGVLPEGARTALGLAPGARGRACILQLGEDGGFPKIDLTELDPGPAEGGAPASRAQPLDNGDLGLVRLCLLSRDLESAYDTLRERGVEFLSPPQSGEGGMVTVAICRDPDGTLIELLEIHRDRWPG